MAHWLNTRLHHKNVNSVWFGSFMNLLHSCIKDLNSLFMVLSKGELSLFKNYQGE